jgi:hypothetical protein
MENPFLRNVALILGLFASLGLCPTTSGRLSAQEVDKGPKKGESGIELVGRSNKEPPLFYWYVDDAKTKKRVAEG